MIFILLSVVSWVAEMELVVELKVKELLFVLSLLESARFLDDASRRLGNVVPMQTMADFCGRKVQSVPGIHFSKVGVELVMLTKAALKELYWYRLVSFES